MFRMSLVLALCCTLCACASGNQAQRTTDPASQGNVQALEKGKRIYVALTGQPPEDMYESPSAVASQFCKFLMPVAGSTEPERDFVDRETALQHARAGQHDYLFLITLREWRLRLFRGPDTAVDIAVINVADGNTLLEDSLSASCFVMVMGREQSPRECLRPEMDAWLSGAFNADVTNRPWTAPMPSTVWQKR